jgi:hypothetical protein
VIEATYRLAEWRRRERGAAKGDPVKADTHVHTLHSGMTTVSPLHQILREPYNTPEDV